ncbi:MAG: hypothetical protein A2Z40_04085 [Deltaproteobacteria bacterium RBG_19FT_COMBO_60_16]|nr:MAG: hypothetical protein A2Z40_04085 [Deltaproteobacteria bacterium RBG_19FT_COMBO_60_16]
MKNEEKVARDFDREIPFKPSPVSRRIGANVKRLRKGRDRLSLKKMSAELWGASPEYQSKIEAGKSNLTIAKLVAISDYFGVDIYELFLRPGLTVIDREKK